MSSSSATVAPDPSLISPSSFDISDILGNQSLFLSAEPQTKDEISTVFDKCKVTRIVRVMPQSFDVEENPSHRAIFENLMKKKTSTQQNEEKEEEEEDWIHLVPPQGNINTSSNNIIRDDEQLKKLRAAKILQIPVHDMPIEKLLPYFRIVTKFISLHLSSSSSSQEEATAEEKERVLVHCQQGLSRSASCVLAFLVGSTSCINNNSNMETMTTTTTITPRTLTLNEAFELVKKSRPQIRPNLGFVEQLAEWEKEFFFSSSSSSPTKLFDVDEYVLQSYIKRFKSQISEEEIRKMFFDDEKCKKTRNGAWMQQLICERMIELNSEVK